MRAWSTRAASDDPAKFKSQYNRLPEYKRQWRGRKTAERFIVGLAEADLNWVGIHILRGMLEAQAYDRMLAYSRTTGAAKRAKDPEGTRAYNREKMRGYYAADPDAARAKGRAAYQALSPEKKAARAAYAFRWTKAHPLAKQIDRLNYARRKMNAPGRFTTADLAAQFNAQGGLCFYCVTPLASMQIEHIVPLSRGGSNWPENIACACADCNLRKGAKSAAEFFEVIANDRRAA